MAKKLRNRKIKINSTTLRQIGGKNLEKYMDYYIAAWNSDTESDSAAILKKYKETKPIVIFKIVGIHKESVRSWYNIKAVHSESAMDSYIRDTSIHMERCWIVTNDIKLVKHLVEKQGLKYDR